MSLTACAIRVPKLTDFIASGDLWWDRASVRAQGLSAGAAVTSWVDSNGSSQAFTQATAGFKPTWQPTAWDDGKGCIRFDGVDDRMVTTFGTALAQPYTLAIVAKFTPSTSTSKYLIDGLANAATAGFISSTNSRLSATGSAAFPLAQISTPIPHAYVFSFNGTSSLGSVDGNGLTSFGTTPAIGSLTPGGFTLAARYNNTLFADLDVVAVIVLKRALSQDDALGLGAALKTLYAYNPGDPRERFLDPVTGSDTNDGLLPSFPLQTGLRAVNLLGTVPLDAPVSLRIKDGADYVEPAGIKFSRNLDVTVRSWNGGKYTIRGHQTVTSGWTQVGSSPVWQQAFTNLPLAGLATVVVDGMQSPLCPDYQQAVLLHATGSQNAPPTTGFGVVVPDPTGAPQTGTVYVNLPDGSTPNGKSLFLPLATYCLAFTAGGMRQRSMVVNAILYSANGPNLTRTASGTGACVGGSVDVESYGPGGEGASLIAYTTRSFITDVRTKTRGAQNDNHLVHGDQTSTAPGTGPTLVMVDADNAAAMDKGAATHENCDLYLLRGNFHHNGHSGAIAVGYGRMFQQGIGRFENNWQFVTFAGVRGELEWQNYSSGTYDSPILTPQRTGVLGISAWVTTVVAAITGATPSGSGSINAAVPVPT